MHLVTDFSYGYQYVAGLVWKVYKGYKKSTKQDAAIFLFEKRQIEKWDRQEREIMLDKLRKGVSQLTRLRHPQVCYLLHRFNLLPLWSVTV